MAKATQELQNPGDWLQRIATERDGYGRLVTESGGMARAAYRLARARCKAESSTRAEPTLTDLQAAARLLSARLGRGGALPITSVLASDSDIAGLRATHAALAEALRSLPPAAPSSLPQVEARRAEAHSRPSNVTH